MDGDFITSLIEHAGSSTFVTLQNFDGEGRLLREATGREVRYKYDAVGRRTSMTLPRGNVLSYIYRNGQWAEMLWNNRPMVELDRSAVKGHFLGYTVHGQELSWSVNNEALGWVTGATWGANTLANHDYKLAERNERKGQCFY